MEIEVMHFLNLNINQNTTCWQSYCYLLLCILSSVLSCLPLCTCNFSGLRTESRLLKAHLDAPAKEINQQKHQKGELEEKEGVANESTTQQQRKKLQDGKLQLAEQLSRDFSHSYQLSGKN